MPLTAELGAALLFTQKMCFICLFSLSSFFFFPVSVKVSPVTPLLSGVFVHRAFCTYFLRIERVVEMRNFSGGHSRMINLTCNGVESHVT